MAITEKTGVKLKTTRPVGGNDESEAVALMIAEQKYPDIIFAKGSAGNLIDAGAMMDMTDLIARLLSVMGLCNSARIYRDCG